MASAETIRFRKLTAHAHLPTKGSQKAAGFDLCAAYGYMIPARGNGLVMTDLQVQLPHGTYGRIAGRSGLALKTHVVVGAGVIDADYTGNIGIVLFNHGTCDLVIAPGDRVAQLICERISYPVIQEVFDEPTPTERGSDGFGSTELMN